MPLPSRPPFRRFSRLAALALPALVGLAPLARAADGDLLGSVPVVYAPWDSLSRPERIVSREDYEHARASAAFTTRRVLYASAGHAVSALVSEPTARGAKSLPVVVFCRGGWKVGDVAWQYAALFDHFATRGFIVVAPLLRGSDGTEGRDEMGGAEVADVMNVLPLLAKLPGADPARVSLCGESRGGMMVFRALREGFPARAAATWGAFTDLDSLIAGDPALYTGLVRQVWPEWAADSARIVESRSAVRWAEDLRAPLLLMAGGADRGVAPSHATRLAARLEALGRPYRVLVFGGEGHTLRGATRARDEAAIAWFLEHARS